MEKKIKRRQALPLPRPTERSRRNRRPHVSASKDADCQRGSEARVCRRQSLAERGAEARTSVASTRAEGTLASRPRYVGAEARAQRWQSGYVRNAVEPDTMTRRMGVWPYSLFSGSQAGLRGERKISLLDMASMRRGISPGSIRGLDVRRIENNPVQAKRRYAWGLAWGCCLCS